LWCRAAASSGSSGFSRRPPIRWRLLGSNYTTFQNEEWYEAADLAWQARAGDLILFNATWVQIQFDYYFRRNSG